MKKQTLRQFGLILLNTAAFLVAIYLWLVVLLILLDKYSILALIVMIPVGLIAAYLLTRLAARTIPSLKRWLQSLPLQLAVILIVKILEFSRCFVRPIDFGSFIEILLQTLLFSVFAFFLQSITLIRDWIQTLRTSKK